MTLVPGIRVAWRATSLHTVRAVSGAVYNLAARVGFGPTRELSLPTLLIGQAASAARASRRRSVEPAGVEPAPKGLTPLASPQTGPIGLPLSGNPRYVRGFPLLMVLCHAPTILSSVL